MLDIGLVQARPALQVEFRTSLAEDLMHVLSLVLDAPSIEGLDQWVYATQAALPPTLKQDMQTVLIFTQKSDTLGLWMRRLPPDARQHRDFAAFVDWLNAFTQDDYQDLIQSALVNLAHYCEEEQGDRLPAPLLDDAESLKVCLGQKLDGEQLDRAVQLVYEPLELKTQFISVVTRFWEQFYHKEYQRCHPIMERSVAYHSQQNYGGEFDATFTAVTGRRPLKDHSELDDVERVVFFPSCHIGPYVMLQHTEGPLPAVILHFNCRPTSAPEQEETPIIQDLFPPIKALSDETRLQILSLLNGRELYAQEIVELLDISQSAVSRHLKLMLSGGLLKTRRKNSMKYLSINEETLTAVAEGLKRFQGKPEV
jgi:DNA-binding transcriptional ArsR family regulator